MKVRTSSPTLAAIVLIGFTFLAEAAVASNTRALRGQLHKSNSKPIRRRRVQEVQNVALPTEAPLRHVKDSTDREAPIHKEDTKSITTHLKLEVEKDDREAQMKKTKKKESYSYSMSMVTKEDRETKKKKDESYSNSMSMLIKLDREKKTKKKESYSYSMSMVTKEDRETKKKKDESYSNSMSMLIKLDREKKSRNKESYSNSMSMSVPTKQKKKNKGTGSSLSLGYLFVKQREIPTMNLQKCLKPKTKEKTAVKKTASLKEAGAKEPELDSTDLAQGEEVKEGRGGIRRREQDTLDGSVPAAEIMFNDTDAVDVVAAIDALNTIETIEDANETISNDTEEDEEVDQFADFHIICDADGNLLAGETWAPTMAPNDEDVTLDTDGDGMTDVEENKRGTDSEKEDTDGDGLTDLQEVLIVTDPLVKDTDGDGYTDGEEVKADSDPLNPNSTPDIIDSDPDSDADGLTDEKEGEIGTDASNPDSDGDGLSDGDEVNIYHTDPLNPDSDGDGLSDHDEVSTHGTNPNLADTDGDGMNDSTEVTLGFDPLAPATNEKDTPSPGCDAFSRAAVYKTKIPARVQFEYEVAIDIAADENDINKAMESKMARFVGKQLINCDKTRSLDGEDAESLGHRYLSQHRNLLVDGVDSTPADIVTTKTCKFFSASNEATPDNSKCYNILSFMTLYLREDSVLTSKLQSSSKALKAILTAFNNESPSPFLEGQGGEFSVEGLKGVHYMHGYADDGVKYEYDDKTGGDANPSGKPEPAPFSQPLIISLLCIGAAFLIFAIAFFVVTRKRGQVTEETYAEFANDGFGGDLDVKNHGEEEQSTDDEADSLSNNSPNQMVFRSAHNEDDSVFAGLDSVLPYDETSRLDETPRSSPTFVQNHIDEGSLAMTVEKGFEYVPKEQAEHPTYDNPARLDSNGRPYRADDTIVL